MNLFIDLGWRYSIAQGTIGVLADLSKDTYILEPDNPTPGESEDLLEFYSYHLAKLFLWAWEENIWCHHNTQYAIGNKSTYIMLVSKLIPNL